MRRLIDTLATIVVATAAAGPIIVCVGAMLLAATIIIELWRHYMGMF